MTSVLISCLKLTVLPDHVKAYLQKAFAPEFLSNWALAFIGLFGVIAALKTLSVIKRQSVSMRRQTTILRHSVDATIASERAWVMADADYQTYITTASRSDGTKYTSVGLSLLLSNQGKTPAQIVEKRIRLWLPNLGKPLPDEPTFDPEDGDTKIHYLQSGQKWSSNYSVNADGEPSIAFQPLVCGVVKYKHMFSDEIVQTTFAYSVSADGGLTRLESYPKYNKNS